MTIDLPVRLTGASGSPYTRKMVALLRYRRIPHRPILTRQDQHPDLPQPKVRLLPTFYLPGDDGELEAVIDSTPLLRRLEEECEGRHAVPSDPVLAFVDALIEDYADEWLTKCMFHYRWHFAEDADQAAAILPRWRNVSSPEEEMLAQGEVFKQRQVSRLWVVGSNEVTAPVIEESYARFLDVFRTVLEQQPFLMGERPGASDFAVFGQLSQLAQFDPTPRALTLEKAPRVFAWCDILDDLAGYEADEAGWLTRDTARAVLSPLLTEVGRVYAPFLVANAEALQSGDEELKTTIDSRPWMQKPFPYQGKCLLWLREAHAALSADDRTAVDTILQGTGCEQLFV